MRKTVDDTNRRTGFTPGGFNMAGGTIRSIFQLAYPSEAADPVGAPDWMSAERFRSASCDSKACPPPLEIQAIFLEILRDAVETPGAL